MPNTTGTPIAMSRDEDGRIYPTFRLPTYLRQEENIVATNIAVDLAVDDWVITTGTIDSTRISPSTIRVDFSAEQDSLDIARPIRKPRKKKIESPTMREIMACVDVKCSDCEFSKRVSITRYHCDVMDTNLTLHCDNTCYDPKELAKMLCREDRFVLKKESEQNVF